MKDTLSKKITISRTHKECVEIKIGEKRFFGTPETFI